MSAATLKAAATGQLTPQAARNPYETLKHQLEQGKAEFKPLLGTDANVDRFIRVVLNSVMTTPDLLEADRRSLVGACLRAAQDGLMPDGREAVLNIYNTKTKINGRDEWIKKAQYLPMVAGLVKKLYESGEVTYVDAAAVYANDKFVFRRGDEPRLEHEPTMDDDAGIIVAAYAVIKLKNGEVKREVMPRRDIEAVRGASKSKDNGPWVTWYDQQAIKSVIKRAYKQLPKSDALEKIIASDNEALGFAGPSPSVGDLVAHHPALENNPAETLRPVISDQAEAVHQARDAHMTERASTDGPVTTYAEVIAAMLIAKTRDSLDEAATQIQFVGNKGQREELGEKYENLRAALES